MSNSSQLRVFYSKAIEYLSIGLCVIPVLSRTKRPALRRWRQYQRVRPTEYELRHWWDTAPETEYGIAIVCGQVSGGLVVLDFDTMDLYRQWLSLHRALAKSAPIVATSRGRHVYVRVADPVRTSSVGGIDIRAEGSYVVAPPSIHPSGKPYRLLSGSWRSIPTVDPDSLHLDTQAHALPTNRSSTNRSPTSRDTLLAVFDRAKHIETPPAGDQYLDPAMKALVALCYCLSEHHQGRAYPLSCRVAGEAIGVSHITAARWLRNLVHDGILAISREAQHAARMAAEYRWIAETASTKPDDTSWQSEVQVSTFRGVFA